MAGIGFELKRILAEDTYSSMVKGFFYSTVISAGPWLMSVLCLAGLGIYSVAFLGFEERQLFSSAVVYIYATSLVGTGLLQMVITRYLSDKLYHGAREALAETFVPIVLLTVAIQLPIAVGVLWGAPLPGSFKISAATGLLVISLIWQTMIFLSASRDYLSIVIAFLMGAVVSVAAGLLWGKHYGLSGYINGFVFGQFCILALLTLKVTREFGVSARQDWSFLRYIRQYPQLVAIGLCYNLSIWIDKLLFGLSTFGRITAERFPTYNQYDSSMFLAFATMVPAMGLFLARTETDFAEVYKRYYDDIFFRRSYDQILKSKRAMTDVLGSSFFDLCKLQGLVTFLFIYFADDILYAVKLPYSQTSMFRYALLGAFMQVMMLFLHVILLYFDLRGTVTVLTVLFLVANTLLSAASLALGFPFYGAGFAAACFISLLVTVLVLYWRIRDLEFITFAKRKIVGQTRPKLGDRARKGGMYGRYLPCPGGEGRLKSKVLDD